MGAEPVSEVPVLTSRKRRAWGVLGVAVGLAFLFTEIVENPEAARVKKEFSRLARDSPLPAGSLLGTCQETSGWVKAFVACSYTGTVESRALEKHYDAVLTQEGWDFCGAGGAPESDMAWRLYCKKDWEAELTRQAGEETSGFGLTLTWSKWGY